MEPIQRQGLRIAVLDLYNGVANQGMRCIREMLLQLRETQERKIDWDEFNVRQKNELPDLTYDIFISSGGPGSPLETEGAEWETVYFEWLQQIEQWNNEKENTQKK